MALLPWLSMKGKSTHKSKLRIAVLALFSLYSCSNAMQWLTYAPVQSQSKVYFNMTTNQLNYLSTIYNMLYILLAVFSCVGLEKVGLRWCLLLGTGLNFLGALLKVVLGFPSNTFAKAFSTQVLNSLSQIFVLSVPPTLASVWFAEKERATATAIGSVANAFGSALGMLIPPLIVQGISTSSAAASSEAVGNSLLFASPVIGGQEGSLFGQLMGNVSNTTATAVTTLIASTFTSTTSVMPQPSVPDLDATGKQFLTLFIIQMVICGTAFLGVVFIVPFEDGAVTEDADDAMVAESDNGNTNAPSNANPGSEGQQHLMVGDTVVDRAGGTTADQRSEVASTLSTVTGVPGTDERTPLMAKGASSPSTKVVKDSDESISHVFVSIYRVLRDRDACLLLCALSISVGSVWAVNSLLAQLLAPINISEGDAGQMGFWNIVLGTVVAIVSGFAVDKFRVYKAPLCGLALFNLTCLSLLIMIIYLDVTPIGAEVNASSRMGAFAVVVLAGIPQNVITPIGFEFLMELTYGQPDSISGGLLMALANAIGLAQVTAGSFLLGDATVAPKANALQCFWLVWGCGLVGCILMTFPRNRLLRYEAQKARDAEKAIVIQ